MSMSNDVLCVFACYTVDHGSSYMETNGAPRLTLSEMKCYTKSLTNLRSTTEL